MAINASFTGDFTAIDLSQMTDQMRAEVTADFVKERFRATDVANAALTGGKLPFTLEVNGQVVVKGSIGVFPEKLLIAALRGRSRPIVDVTWHYEFVKDSALEQAIGAYTRANTTLQRIQNSYDFAMLVVNAREDPGALLRALLVRYAQFKSRQSPQLMRGVSEARRLYKTYRRIQIAQGILTGGKGGDVDPNVEVLAWIAAELQVRSPVVSGNYRDSHTLYADGAMIANASDVDDAFDLPEAEEYTFTNTVPYSRKIELGTTKSGRAFVVQVEPHIYENVAQDAASRFQDEAEIDFDMRAVLAGEQVNQSKAPSYGQSWWLGGAAPRSASGVRESRLARVHGNTAHNNPNKRFPCIVVRFR